MSGQTRSAALPGVERGAQSTLAFWLPRALALLAAALAPLPLILDLKLGITMAGTGPIIWPLSVALLVAAVLLAGREHEHVLVRTLLVALLAGPIATATYDAFRIAGLSAGIVPMDEAFDFGQRLTGQVAAGEMADMHEATGAESHGAARADSHGATGGDSHGAAAGGQTAAAQGNRGVTTLLGYLYHYWNGTMFGLAFLVLFGARRWWPPIPYMVLIIYVGMVLVMGVHSVSDFFLEAVGHAAFGVTLGVLGSAYLGQLSSGGLFPFATPSTRSAVGQTMDR